jgi:hypothetical protein
MGCFINAPNKDQEANCELVLYDARLQTVRGCSLPLRGQPVDKPATSFLWVRAKKRIEPRTELLLDYAADFWEMSGEENPNQTEDPKVYESVIYDVENEEATNTPTNLCCFLHSVSMWCHL